MTLKLISGPDLPITVEQARKNSRIDSDYEDDLVEAYIRAALAHVEKWTGAAFKTQTWELVLDEFPEDEIEIPYGPVASITSVKYIDADGAQQETADYETDLEPEDRAWLFPVSEWPTTMETVNAVRVRFVAGTTPPPDVLGAIFLLVDHFYTNRTATSGDGLQAIPFGVESLLGLHRRLFV